MKKKLTPEQKEEMRKAILNGGWFKEAPAGFYGKSIIDIQNEKKG